MHWGLIVLATGLLASYRLLTLKGSQANMLGSAFLVIVAVYGTIRGVYLIVHSLR